MLSVGADAGWFTFYGTGALETQDNSGTITNPGSHITDANKNIVVIPGGTLLIFRMRYDDGIGTITDGIVKVFGRLNENNPWELLRSQDEAITQTLTTNAADAEDGTNNFTTPDYNANVYDKLGNNEFIVGVTTAHAAGSGDATLSILQVKVL